MMELQMRSSFLLYSYRIAQKFDGGKFDVFDAFHKSIMARYGGFYHLATIISALTSYFIVLPVWNSITHISCKRIYRVCFKIELYDVITY